MNLVKLQKNKIDNTLVLDIITAENRTSEPTYQFRFDKQIDKNLAKFSFISQMSDGANSNIPEVDILHGIRFFSLIWVVLLNVVTVLSYAASM